MWRLVQVDNASTYFYDLTHSFPFLPDLSPPPRAVSPRHLYHGAAGVADTTPTPWSPSGRPCNTITTAPPTALPPRRQYPPDAHRLQQQQPRRRRCRLRRRSPPRRLAAPPPIPRAAPPALVQRRWPRPPRPRNSPPPPAPAPAATAAAAVAAALPTASGAGAEEVGAADLFRRQSKSTRRERGRERKRG